MATRFFQYDEMTWDAVAALPRDTPLILPLGSGYDPSAPLTVRAASSGGT